MTILGCRWIVLILGIIWLSMTGCSQPSTPPTFEFLIRVNDRSISVGDFNNRFDAASAEIPTQGPTDPAVERDLKLRLLHQLTEELILLERAVEMELTVTDEELQVAISRIRADYPEGEFEKVLLEQAISYSNWKKQLRTRLLKEKVVSKDLEASVVLTPEEMSASYEALYPPGGTAQDEHLDEAEIDAKVVKLVRRKKAQETYQAWFDSLQHRYTVEINAAAWEKIIDS